LTDEELERLLGDGESDRVEKRRYRDRPFDAHPVASATLADLSRTLFEQEYLPAAFASDVLAANVRSYEQRLAATKMVASADDPIPTVAGLLVLGTRPRDFVPGTGVALILITQRHERPSGVARA
jgi:ATP-dependent DNA helicase RecG